MNRNGTHLVPLLFLLETALLLQLLPFLLSLLGAASSSTVQSTHQWEKGNHGKGRNKGKKEPHFLESCGSSPPAGGCCCLFSSSPPPAAERVASFSARPDAEVSPSAMPSRILGFRGDAEAEQAGEEQMGRGTRQWSEVGFYRGGGAEEGGKNLLPKWAESPSAGRIRACSSRNGLGSPRSFSLGCTHR